MPVDLSMTGLTGQVVGRNLQQMEASTAQTRVNTAAKQAELDDLARKQALADTASRTLNDIAHRRKTSNDIGVEDQAANMNSLAEPLEVVGDIYMRGGAPESGMEFLKSASEIRKRESDMNASQAKSQQDKLENIIKGADVVSRYLGQAKNQSEWDYGVEQLRRQGVLEPDHIEAMARMPYNPDVAAYFNEQAISAADKARLDMTAQTNRRVEEKGLAELAQGERKIQMQAARDRESARHNQAMEKVSGGKTATSVPPNSDAMKSAKAALQNTVYKGAFLEDEPEFESAANYISSQALAAVKENKALDWDTAVQQAIIRAQQAGAFGTEGGEPTWFGLGKNTPKVPTFDAQGIDPETAAPMPSAKSEMKKGRYYITARGRARWNGEAFEAAE